MPKILPMPFSYFSRKYRVVAIETSCDDTSVCIIDKNDKYTPPVLIGHIKHSLDTTHDGGIVPKKAHLLHQQMVGQTVHDLLKNHRDQPVSLVCATRGPGMNASLASGYEVAKGLAVGWNVPLIGVHHMLGHLLTPRMFNWQVGSVPIDPLQYSPNPLFPFLSLLASGGHTILVLSSSLFDHKIIANTVDIAVGDAIDKCAREIGLKGIMLGSVLEKFVKQGQMFNSYASLTKYPSLKFPDPLKDIKGRVNTAAFSFAPFTTSIKENIAKKYPNATRNNICEVIPLEHRYQIAYEIQEAIFDHITKRMRSAINPGYISKTMARKIKDELRKGKNYERTKAPREDLLHIKDLVLSGGVGSNLRFRDKIRESFPNIENFHFPEPEWCSDNAVMIGWAGIELWENGIETDLRSYSQPKWSIEDLTKIEGWRNQKKNVN
ncbi:peptidase M22, glycoprotease [Nadsonia fulvescens var. elongata DSM 6958]|uniref:N(6)-L-threonylcarbamoyladenine synthase n=1 Tax=Nadsonia fulvescens var. elongata DSM 6958 TaxID=857566 RepID=A0A1E3PPA3_9ASCO|nr:peptidase M22, glycoprotease [Nadsonia fulvescens var. elongata DSM 6958]